MRDPRFQAQSRLLITDSFLCESGNVTGYCESYAGNYDDDNDSYADVVTNRVMQVGQCLHNRHIKINKFFR